MKIYVTTSHLYGSGSYHDCNKHTKCMRQVVKDVGEDTYNVGDEDREPHVEFDWVYVKSSSENDDDDVDNYHELI